MAATFTLPPFLLSSAKADKDSEAWPKRAARRHKPPHKGLITTPRSCMTDAPAGSKHKPGVRDFHIQAASKLLFLLSAAWHTA